MYYNEEKENIEKYKYLIMLGLNRKELKEFSEKYGDDIVKEYDKVINKIIEDGGLEPLFDWKEDQRRIYNSELSLAKKEGLLQTAKNMLKKGMSVEDISEVTNLSIKEVQDLIK